MSSEKKASTYAEAGVDTDAQRRTIEALTDQIGFQRKGDGRPMMGMTHFAGLVKLGDRALAICTDGVGTKAEVANRLRRWDTIGIDAIAMNVNDCICVGAEPLAFVDYLAVQKPDVEFSRQIGRGLNAGAKQANVTLAGGETAVLPEIVNGFDLAGTCVGVVDSDKILDGKAVRKGDAIIGLASSGLHANGYTLARRILADHHVDLHDPCPATGGRTWGEVLLEPTRIYVRPVLKLLEKVEVHGLANVTGGGLRNLPRIHPHHQYRLTDPFEVPAVFQGLHGLGEVEWQEMYRTFNMGLGFVAVVAEDEAQDAVKLLRKEGEEAKVIGRVEAGRGAVLEGLGLTYDSKTADRVY